MSKRHADAGRPSSPEKRQKRAHPPTPLPPPEPIHTARQLGKLLDYQGPTLIGLREGLHSFKAFLDSILYAADKSSVASQISILQDYLRSQIPQNAEAALPVLMQAWSVSLDTNYEPLLSSIPSVLALLLRTISTSIDFRDFGLAIGRTLLQQSQLKLIAGALDSLKHKKHLISPCLRLLTEVVSFDGGTFADKVLAASTFTFDSRTLSRNLHLWEKASFDPEQDRLRPSVRTHAVRYLLACIKHVAGTAISNLLTNNSNVSRALFEHIKHDPLDVMKNILDTFKSRILLDKSISRSSKTYIINDHCLSSIASVFKEPQDDSPDSTTTPERHTIAYNFLELVCSKPEAGVLRSFAGWAPPLSKASAEFDAGARSTEIDLGLDSIEWYDAFRTQVPVRNTTLSKFSQHLRTHANMLEVKLLLQMFKAAPELVADFFFRKSRFTFDPKLTATWVGYSSFLFSTISLPVPEYFGRRSGYDRVPPPASIVIENILPLPLTQKSLTRCLNQSVEVITFFSIHILCVAFEKLSLVLSRFEEASRSQGALWEEGAARVRDEFTARCPNFKTIISTMRQTAQDNELQLEAILRLISLYYQVLPQATVDEKFDVSVSLGEALAIYESPAPESSTDNKGSGLQMLQLGHLLRISSHNSDMRWWQKAEALRSSPFASLLRIASRMPVRNIPNEIRALILSIFRENGVLQFETQISAVDAVIASLRYAEQEENLDNILDFLNDACARTTRKPVKYEDDLDALTHGLDEVGPVSLLGMALVEQWPFVLEQLDVADGIARWLGLYLGATIAIGEDKTLVDRMRAQLLEKAKTDEHRRLLTLPTVKVVEEEIERLTIAYDPPSPPTNGNKETEQTTANVDIELHVPELAPPGEDPKHRGLHRWSTKDVESAIVDGDLASLILCLSSRYAEVQKLALRNLRQFAMNLDTEPVKSNYADAPQISLLLGLLINTVTPLVVHESTGDVPNGTTHFRGAEAVEDQSQQELRVPNVPHACTIYAVMALQVLQDPLHPLYQKINTFHTRSPKWRIDRLVSYWTHQILFEPPTPSYTTTGATRATKPDVWSYEPTLDPSSSFPFAGIPSNPQAFLLSYVYAMLRTAGAHAESTLEPDQPSADLHILQARGTLEPLIALANNPFQPLSHFALLLRILWRITFLHGGSTMLITRKGIVGVLAAWIAKRDSSGGSSGSGNLAKTFPNRNANIEDERPKFKQDSMLASVPGLKTLLRRIWDSCDRDYVDTWSQGTMEGIVLQTTGD